MKIQRVLLRIALTLAIISINLHSWSREVTAEKILALATEPSHVVAKGHYLYWSDASEQPIKKLDICGGEPIALASKMGIPVNFIINGKYIYWIDGRDEGWSPSGSCTGASDTTWILNKTLLDRASSIELARGDNCSYGATDIVVDDTSVYWVNSTTSPSIYTLNKVPTTGGDSITFVTSEHIPIESLASDTTHIYWSEDSFPDDPPSSTIKKKPKIGGQTELLVSGLRDLRGGLIVYGGEVYFTEFNGWDTYSLMKVSVAGGAVTTLASVTRGLFEDKNWPIAITVDDEKLYWVDKNFVNSVPVDGGSISVLASVINTPLDIAVNSEQVYWTEDSGPIVQGIGTLKSVPTWGGDTSTLFQGEYAPRNLVLDNDMIYWNEGGPYGLIQGWGRIAKKNNEGGNVISVLNGIQADSPPIACDGRSVYVADKWSVKKISKDGTLMKKLASSLDEVGDLDTDGESVYWIVKYLSTVHKVPVDGGQIVTLSGQLKGYAGPIKVRNGYTYWISSNDEISKVNVAGGEVISLASDLPFLNDLVVDDTNVYFSEHDTGRIRKILINGGDISTIHSLNPTYAPFYLTADDQNIYWISQKTVGAIPKTGGDSVLIDNSVLSDPYLNASIAVDATGVYWTETAVGAIMKYELGPCVISKAMPWIPLLLLGN